MTSEGSVKRCSHGVTLQLSHLQGLPLSTHEPQAPWSTEQARCEWVPHRSSPCGYLVSLKDLLSPLTLSLRYTAPGGVVCAHWLDCHCSHSSALPSAHVVPAKFSIKSSLSKSGNGFCHLWPWELSICAVPTPLSVVIFVPLIWDTGSLVNKFLYTVAHTSTAGAGRWGEADNSAISPLARHPQNILLPHSLCGDPLTLALRACPRRGIRLLSLRRA